LDRQGGDDRAAASPQLLHLSGAREFEPGEPIQVTSDARGEDLQGLLPLRFAQLASRTRREHGPEAHEAVPVGGPP